MTYKDIVEEAPHIGVKNLSKEQMKDRYMYFKDWLEKVMDEKVSVEPDENVPKSKVTTLRIHKAMISRPDDPKAKMLMDYINKGAYVYTIPSDSAFITFVVVH